MIILVYLCPNSRSCSPFLRLFLWVPFDRLPREGKRRRGGIKKKVTDKKLFWWKGGKGLPGGRFLNCGGEKRRWVEGGKGGFIRLSARKKEEETRSRWAEERRRKGRRRMVPEQQKRFPFSPLRIYYGGSGSRRGSMEFFYICGRVKTAGKSFRISACMQCWYFLNRK